jgi:hypothetical protein
MNAYEIEQVEKHLRLSTDLPLSYAAWADIEQRARAQRSRVIGEAIAGLFAALSARIARFVGQVRHTAADCTDARLRHS